VRTGKSDPSRLDEAGAARLAATVPGTEVHADLASFAEFVVQRERRARAAARGEADAGVDSGPGGLR
jgi:D-glycero-D-manno-heptose 1,7-bisphosphate phosphatase